eukprot:365973_1
MRNDNTQQASRSDLMIETISTHSTMKSPGARFILLCEIFLFPIALFGAYYAFLCDGFRNRNEVYWPIIAMIFLTLNVFSLIFGTIIILCSNKKLCQKIFDSAATYSTFLLIIFMMFNVFLILTGYHKELFPFFFGIVCILSLRIYGHYKFKQSLNPVNITEEEIEDMNMIAGTYAMACLAIGCLWPISILYAFYIDAKPSHTSEKKKYAFKVLRTCICIGIILSLVAVILIQKQSDITENLSPRHALD